MGFVYEFDGDDGGGGVGGSGFADAGVVSGLVWLLLVEGLEGGGDAQCVSTLTDGAGY